MEGRNVALVIGAAVGILVVGAVLSGVLTFGDADHTDVEPAEESGDVDSIFEGEITNVNVESGTVSGIGEYDDNCIPVDPENEPMSLVTCDAGIDTEEYGTLNFHYEHDMSEDPCITSGDEVELELHSDGTATAHVEYR